MRSLLAATLLFAACATTEGPDPECTGGKCDGAGVDQTCSDTHYGDGVCQTQLSCGVPDIDCFETFSDDTTAATWYATQEAWVAQQKGKPAPRAIVPTTDPRYAQARALLDKGWAAFQAHRPVGKLAMAKPALVLVDDSEPNAYVIPDTQKNLSAFSVQVQTGLLAVGSDDERLGVMMHELQHAVGLHLIGDTRDRIQKFYAATSEGEPIGRAQPDDAAVRLAMTAWLGAASQIGPHSDAMLGGVPVGGDLVQVLSAVVSSGLQNNAAACQAPAQQINAVLASASASADSLSGAFTSDPTQTLAAVNAAMTALRDQCLPNLPYSFLDVVAKMQNTTPAAIAAQMDPADLALVQNKHVIDAIAALTIDRRSKMRFFEGSLPNHNAWPNARYFSFEEDADDVALFVLRAAGAKSTALGDFFVSLLKSVDPATGQRCAQILDAGQRPSYGVDLTDPHHATCFRAYHLRELALYSAPTSRLAPTPAPTTILAAPAPLPIPHTEKLPID